MRHAIQTEITIEAPVEVVWRHLTDLAGYRDWNPFIVESSGQAVVGAKLINRMQPPGGRAVTFKPTVTEVETERTFEWLGRLVLPGLFDGRHRFELQPTAEGSTRLLHGEEFQGVLVRLFRKSLDTNTVAGFEAMNAALQGRAEAQARSAD